jgi:hypothetical protein
VFRNLAHHLLSLTFCPRNRGFVSEELADADRKKVTSSFAPNYAPPEIFEIASKLYKKAKNL